MNNRKTVIRFFTIADYEEEEIWLHNQHKSGWRLVKMTPPCFFTFERCTPEEIVYRLDYQNNAETKDYFQLFQDYSWEYIGRCIGWLYFRKPAAAVDAEQDGELFSDSESRINLIDHVIKTRLLPLLIVFLCCILPNFIRLTAFGAPLQTVFTVFFTIMTLLYLYLIVYCGLKLRKLRERLQTQ